MAVNENLKRLVDLSAPLWAGEAEVVWSYFQSPERSKESDLTWLARQCYKELWGSGVGDKKKGLFLGRWNTCARLGRRSTAAWTATRCWR
jgi:hypothetical protein